MSLVLLILFEGTISFLARELCSCKEGDHVGEDRDRLSKSSDQVSVGSVVHLLIVTICTSTGKEVLKFHSISYLYFMSIVVYSYTQFEFRFHLLPFNITRERACVTAFHYLFGDNIWDFNLRFLIWCSGLYVTILDQKGSIGDDRQAPAYVVYNSQLLSYSYHTTLFSCSQAKRGSHKEVSQVGLHLDGCVGI